MKTNNVGQRGSDGDRHTKGGDLAENGKNSDIVRVRAEVKTHEVSKIFNLLRSLEQRGLTL